MSIRIDNQSFVSEQQVRILIQDYPYEMRDPLDRNAERAQGIGLTQGKTIGSDTLNPTFGVIPPWARGPTTQAYAEYPTLLSVRGNYSNSDTALRSGFLCTAMGVYADDTIYSGARSAGIGLYKNWRNGFTSNPPFPNQGKKISMVNRSSPFPDIPVLEITARDDPLSIDAGRFYWFAPGALFSGFIFDSFTGQGDSSFTRRWNLGNSQSSLSGGPLNVFARSSQAAARLIFADMRNLMGTTGYTGRFPIASFGYIGVGRIGVIRLDRVSVELASVSDYRQKNDIRDFDDGIEYLRKIQPRRFDWISEPAAEPDFGFIAHELQAVMPAAVSGTKDAVDQTGEPVYQCVSNHALVPMLTSALRDLSERARRARAQILSRQGNPT